MAAASPIIGCAYAEILAEADAEMFEALWRVHDLLMRGRLAESLRSSGKTAAGSVSVSI